MSDMDYPNLHKYMLPAENERRMILAYMAHMMCGGRCLRLNPQYLHAQGGGRCAPCASL
jgi:hypothetical protein